MYEREVPLFKQEHVLEAIAIALLCIMRIRIASNARG